jgi:hypothetical protein
MTDQQHPITPPIKLVDQWADKYQGHMPEWILRHVAAEAAQWGADEELEACCNWLEDPCAADMFSLAKDLQYSRRPKPPSLKEQALAALEADPKNGAMIMLDAEQFKTIRRALEALPND